MADITITIPPEVVQRVLDAFAAVYGFDPENEEEQTKAQFARECVIRYVKEVTKGHEAVTASEAARVQALETADAEVEIT